MDYAIMDFGDWTRWCDLTFSFIQVWMFNQRREIDDLVFINQILIREYQSWTG